MYIKKLRIFGLFLTQIGPKNDFPKIKARQVRHCKEKYEMYSKNWNSDIQRIFQLEKHLQRYSSFNLILWVKWKLHSTFKDLRALWPPLTEQDNASKNNQKLESRHGITSMGFVSLKCFNDVYRIFFDFLYNMSEESPGHSILPVKTPLSTNHVSHYWQDFW